MFDTIDTPQSPSPSSFAARVTAIEQEIIAAEGYLTVDGRYFAREADTTSARQLDAERRCRAETRYKGALRTLMAELEAAATHRGRTLERRGLTDEQCPSLDVAIAMNGVLRLVESMTRRLAQLERAQERRTVGFVVTELGRQALAAETVAVAS